MVGVNGAAISNLNPPTLAAVTFGIAQAGLALLLRGPLTRWTRRPLAWAAIAVANLSAMTLFLWHQTAFITVTMLGSLFGRLPGLADGTVQPGLDRRAALPGSRRSPLCSDCCGRSSGGRSSHDDLPRKADAWTGLGRRRGDRRKFFLLKR